MATGYVGTIDEILLNIKNNLQKLEETAPNGKQEIHLNANMYIYIDTIS